MVSQSTFPIEVLGTGAAAQAFLTRHARRRLLHDLACVDAVLASWDEWPDHPDRCGGVPEEALRELRALLVGELALFEPASRTAL